MLLTYFPTSSVGVSPHVGMGESWRNIYPAAGSGYRPPQHNVQYIVYAGGGQQTLPPLIPILQMGRGGNVGEDDKGEKEEVEDRGHKEDEDYKGKEIGIVG